MTGCWIVELPRNAGLRVSLMGECIKLGLYKFPPGSIKGGHKVNTYMLIYVDRRTKNISGEWLIAKPDTSSMLVQEEVDFIILGSDGLWDSLNRYRECF